VLGLIGCGAQAVTQAHAISLALPKLQEILFFDTDSSTMTSLPARLAPLRLKASAKAAALDQLMPKADILCTATSVDVAGGPVFTEGTEKSSLHINAVGSDFPGKTEVPLALLRRARVCPDFRDQAIAEGECQQLRPDEIGVDLATIAGNPEDFAHYRDEQTVFDSTGWAVEDLAAMEMVMGYAEELQLGQRVELESVFEDPMNPYEFDAPAPLIAHASSF
ncbi:MAG: ornithine cyclodeaminase family protein, partial [Verrucomicrobiales bacterium]